MAWRILIDHLHPGGEGESRTGVIETHSRIPLIAAAAGFESEPLPDRDGPNYLPLIRFRLKDDDGEIYYEGELHDDPECANQLAALRYGEGDAGCTTIEVKRDGEWVIEIG